MSKLTNQQKINSLSPRELSHAVELALFWGNIKDLRTNANSYPAVFINRLVKTAKEYYSE